MVTAAILPFRENSHGRAGNRTRDLMISSQRLWTLDHEAGLKLEYGRINQSRPWLPPPTSWDRGQGQKKTVEISGLIRFLIIAWHSPVGYIHKALQICIHNSANNDVTMEINRNCDWNVLYIESYLTFWRRNYFFLILAHPVYKMWIIQEPNTLELWNKLHFEEKKTESIYHV